MAKQASELPRKAYTVREVAAMTGVEHKAIRQAIYRGELRARRLGDGPRAKWLVTAAALDEWLAA